MQIGTSGLQSRGVKWSTTLQEVKGQGSKWVKLVNMIFPKQMNRFCCKLTQVVYGASSWNYQLLGSCEISQQLSDEFLSNLAGTNYGECPLCNPGAKGQGHTRPKLALEACQWHHFLSASLYFSKRGTYWDRLCRDVICWLVVTLVHCDQKVHPRPVVTMEH